MLPWIECGIVYLCSYGSSSCCLGSTLTLLSMFSWFLLMLPWIDWDIVYQCYHGSTSCCLGLIVTLFISILMVFPYVALDWLWHCLSVFSWFFLMLHWIDCDIVYQYSHGSSLCCIGLIVTLFISILMVLPHVAFDWLWHCLSVFSWFFLMLPWIDCGIVYLCSHGSSSCCLGLIVALFICVLMILPHVALVCDIVCLCHQGIFMLHWTDCDIFRLYSFDASSCFIGWIVPLCVCNIVYLCSYDSTSSCLRLIASLFNCVHMVLPHVAFDWLCYCLSVFLGSTSCCLGLIVTLIICVLMTLPYVAFDWVWHCLSVFLWLYLILPSIDCVIVYLCSHGSSSCCLRLIVLLFIPIPMVLPHVALDWLWH